MPYRIAAILYAPLQRLDSVPGWGWVLAVIAGAWEYISTDAFSKILALVVLTGAADYYLGAKSARLRGRFSPVTAQMGVHGKVAGIVLLLLVRLFEGWAQQHGFVALNGGVATALAVALFAVDVQSISHHRELFGATPLPLLGGVLAWIRGVATVKLPPPRPPREDDDAPQ